jgi:hypothetical protein
VNGNGEQTTMKAAIFARIAWFGSMVTVAFGAIFLYLLFTGDALIEWSHGEFALSAMAASALVTLAAAAAWARCV